MASSSSSKPRRRALVLGTVIALSLLAVAAYVATSETGRYTSVVGGEIAAGVSKWTSCKVAESKPSAPNGGPVVRLETRGVVWIFIAERLGRARVSCGLFGRLTYTIDVLEPTRLEVIANDTVREGETTDFYAIGFDARGARISSDVLVSDWRVTGPLERRGGDTSCEFPPWCGGPGAATYRGLATAPGTATVEAVIGQARGAKTIKILPK